MATDLELYSCGETAANPLPLASSCINHTEYINSKRTIAVVNTFGVCFHQSGLFSLSSELGFRRTMTNMKYGVAFNTHGNTDESVCSNLLTQMIERSEALPLTARFFDERTWPMTLG